MCVPNDQKSEIVSKMCPCARKSDTNCGKCILAKWNVDAISKAFNPKLNTPKAEVRDAVNSSPLLKGIDNQALLKLTRDIHPRLGQLVVPSYNRMAQLSKQLGLM
jgi:hypothetical protein